MFVCFFVRSFITFFVRNILNDAVSCSDYIASSGRITSQHGTQRNAEGGGPIYYPSPSGVTPTFSGVGGVGIPVMIRTVHHWNVRNIITWANFLDVDVAILSHYYIIKIVIILTTVTFSTSI